MQADLIELFRTVFDTDRTPRLFFAPGRINLIGEHTDYNGGHVFPAAISFGTYAAAVKRSDNRIRVFSANFPEQGVIECCLNQLAYDNTHHWANYPKGMLYYMLDAGYQIDSGVDIVYDGNIPNSSGLSSSASIEMVTGTILEKLFELNIDRIDMAFIGKQVENEYLKINSGIMDQFAISMGRSNHAILLDVSTMHYEYAPIQLNGYKILIMNTNKQRTLAGSAYNDRRSACERALADLQRELSITSLGQLSKNDFDHYAHLILDATDRKRARHAVYENSRTLEAFERLTQGDLAGFGALMNASHQSLADDYEVTGAELDTLVHTAWKQDGVLGTRMTGAGFGGCAIAIIETDAVESFKQAVNTVYQNQIGCAATFYTADIGDGAKEI